MSPPQQATARSSSSRPLHRSSNQQASLPAAGPRQQAAAGRWTCWQRGWYMLRKCHSRCSTPQAAVAWSSYRTCLSASAKQGVFRRRSVGSKIPECAMCAATVCRVHANMEAPGAEEQIQAPPATISRCLALVLTPLRVSSRAVAHVLLALRAFQPQRMLSLNTGGRFDAA